MGGASVRARTSGGTYYITWPKVPPTLPLTMVTRRRSRAHGDSGDCGPRPGIKKNRGRTSWKRHLIWGVTGGTLALLTGYFLWGELLSIYVTEVLAPQHEFLQHRFFQVACSQDYESLKQFEGNFS
ncbi:hypothetical protein GDO86_013753 [Hymenochirus boettgeri]|uniref:Uncharacterized protein n=1 Tax=Hymenochirus boettgeri TaxID=247094 RepID=A0A8T2JP04_9PIPI|nr:hypothetical protein GDO86_013753 [Hymenochirus boettgeri]